MAHARKLLTLTNRERIAALTFPRRPGSKLTIALEMIDAIELQIGPVDLARVPMPASPLVAAR